MHDQSTAVERFVFVTFVDVNSARTKHTVVTGSVNHLPITKFTNDRNFLSSCLLDKCVVGQLATRVVNVIPTALIVWERCLGLFKHWIVTASLMHA